MTNLITTNHLVKNYRHKTALQDVCIHIPTGAIYGLIGNNGAGKTTLMRLLLGLQQPSDGQIQRPEGLRTGAILESPAIYPLWSAKQNLTYQLKLAGAPATDAAALLHMTGLADTKSSVCRFSLGMRMRLGLAMSLAGTPSLLFLDEPLNGLDPSGIRQIRTLLQTLNKERRITIVISSHNLNELQKIATHIGFLKDGRLIHECAASEISNIPLEDFYFENFEKQEA